MPRSTIEAALRLADDGYSVYPVYSNKTPASAHGFKDASNQAEIVLRLFSEYAAPLIGVATGEVSGFDVLDLDLPRHPEAAAWLDAHRHAIPRTRTHRSRSGGLHLLFQHAAGLRCSTARPVVGIDVRANGGGIIWWPATGCPIADHAQLCPWPDWLRAQILPPPRPVFVPAVEGKPISDAYVRAAVNHAASVVANAQEGTRNAVLNAEAWALLRFVATGAVSTQEIATALAGAALAAGLGRREIETTLASVIRARGIG